MFPLAVRLQLPVISSAPPRSQLGRVMRSPVPMLTGKELMGAFSPLVPQGSLVLLEWGLATWVTPKPSNPDLQESNYLPGKRGFQITLLTMQHWTLHKLLRLPLCVSGIIFRLISKPINVIFIG